MASSPLERRITLHQLRLFKEVADRRNFTRAAEALSLSQPAVTHQLQALARTIGHPLLETTRGVTLTAAGQALYERVGRILALVADAADAIEDIAGVRAGDVRIAGDTTVGTYVLPDALAAFHREHPNVGLSLEVVNRARARDLVLRGDVQLGVVGRLWDDGLLDAEPFLENSLLCFSAPTHPLVSSEPLEAADLLHGPLLLRERGSGTRESVETILRSAGVEPVAAMEMTSNGALKRAVAGGLGVTILSSHAVRLELSMGLLRPLVVSGFPVWRTWHIVWARERALSPAASALRSFLHLSDWRAHLGMPLGSE